ncbi:MAG: hypothetical protein ABJL44_16330 [Algibacter sp.]
MKKLIYIFLLSIVFFSCNPNDSTPNENNEENDYLIFGHFYGFCVGETCVEVFKLDSEKLYEDSNDNYANAPFNFEALETDKFELAKDLINFLPAELLSDTETTFGCPDCADGGGLFIEYSKNGVIQNWRIDQMQNNVPTYLHDFVDKVNEKIALINN